MKWSLFQSIHLIKMQNIVIRKLIIKILLLRLILLQWILKIYTLHTLYVYHRKYITILHVVIWQSYVIYVLELNFFWHNYFHQ